ncbi:hypothetical protein BH18ACT10_BH18ACT10_08360 [soil metagenome]|nr:ATP-dependent Clp protease proteolytic subunit [Rubrobacter sp.]
MRPRRAHILLPLLALTAVCAVVACGSDTASRNSESAVYVARIDGEIDQQTAEYVGRVISDAGEADASAVVVTLDTPGGRLDSMQEIVEDISGAKETPVIAYVTPQGARAASAGTFIMMGSDVAAMAPQTRLGAATPVDALGQDIPGDMGEKVTNDAAALITGLAQAHGRNEAWAESAVREAQALDASDARRKGVVEYVQPDLRSVLQAANGASVQPKDLTLQAANATLIRESPNFQERFGIPLYTLVVPLVIVILLGAGAVFAVFRSRRWRAMTGREGMIGELGTVRRKISGSTGGMVFVHGELWRALQEDPDSPPLEPGTDIEIVDFRRAFVIVRPAAK